MSRENDEMESLAEESERTAELSKRLYEAVQREKERAPQANVVSKRLLAAASAAASAAALPLFDAMKGT